MVDFSSVRYEDDQEFKDNIGNFLKSLCGNNAIYDQSDDSNERVCFYKRGRAVFLVWPKVVSKWFLDIFEGDQFDVIRPVTIPTDKKCYKLAVQMK